MMADQPAALLIEDDAAIRKFARLALEAEGFAVMEAESVGAAEAELNSTLFDFLLVDLGLPDGCGMDVIRRVRASWNVPILVLSARAMEKDKVEALDSGADDYLTKPFGVAELQARVRALLRRAQRAVMTAHACHNFGEITVDVDNRSIARSGLPIHLTPREFDLLHFFLQHPEKLLTHRTLLKEVWGAAYIESNHYLRIYVGHLRQKLETDPARPVHFITETGIGYRFIP